MTNRHQLQREPEPVVIPTALRDEVPIGIVKEEEPIQLLPGRRISAIPSVGR
jgi:hypothetical protein